MTKMASERLQIELNRDKAKELDALMKEVKASTKKEYVNAALTLLKWAIEQRRAGRIIASVDEREDAYRELLMPLLSEVRRIET
jgi:hypothetical protein